MGHNPTLGISIQAGQRGIQGGVIWSFLGDTYFRIDLSGGAASHDGGRKYDCSSLVRLVCDALSQENTRGFLLDSPSVRQCLDQLGTFERAGEWEVYSTMGNTYHVLAPFKID